jgi:Kef-type K+ transport system membrane component KefB
MDLRIALEIGALILIASMISREIGVSIAIVEIVLGIIGGNFLKLEATAWIAFLASFGSIVLTFLAGVEVDPDVLRSKFKESLLIGGFSFLIPFIAAWMFAYWALGWEADAAKIAGVALSTTSLAVVYAVLVETGLTNTATGKIIMAATFVTDFGTAAALSILFITPTLWLIPFLAASIVLIVLMPRLQPWFFGRYGNRVTEPEIKWVFAALFLLMFLGSKAQSHAVLPAFLLGLVMAGSFARHRTEQQRLRVVAFSLLTPFFFIKAGMNISLGAVGANFGLVALLFAVKVSAKIAGVYPFARRYLTGDAWYTTLLMSTGLTFGTISATFGLNAGIISKDQFSVLLSVVILTAILPTLIAQRFFEPALPVKDTGRGASRTEALPRPRGEGEA